MCGIAGIICFTNQSAADKHALIQMSCRMKNRGPDDEGYAFFDGFGKSLYCYGNDSLPETVHFRRQSQNCHINDFNQSFKVGLVHRRLSIIDLSPKASQPMSSADQKIWVIFNGEIYNYREIKVLLEGKGYRFTSLSDTEVIINAYREWGIDFIQHLNGMFAIALYDLDRGKIFLIRDRFGMKPVFYTSNGNLFLFASDIKTLIASGLYKPEPDFANLNMVLCFTVSPGQTTAFKNVHSLEPGHYLCININNGNIDKFRYWQLPAGKQKAEMTEIQAIELLKSELEKAVRYTLVSDVEVGSFLSGGLDSSLVTKLSSLHHENIKAFTLGFETITDETGEAAFNAQFMKVKHIISKVNDEEIIKAIKNVVLCYEEPFTTISPTYLLASFVRKSDIKVVLNGLGGDELFAGYGYYKKYKQIEKLKKYSWLIGLMPPFHPKIKKLHEYVGFTSVAEYYAFSMANFKGYEVLKLTGAEIDPIKLFSSFYPADDKHFTDYIEEISYYDFLHYIGKHQVYRADQFMSFFSMEGRFPFLDHNLVEAVATIPSHFKLTENGVSKYLLRKLVLQYFPQEAVNRPKKGFSTPLPVYMDGILKPFVVEKIETLKQRSVFNNLFIDKLLESYQQNKKKIWQLVMTELWFETFFDNSDQITVKP